MSPDLTHTCWFTNVLNLTVCSGEIALKYPGAKYIMHCFTDVLFTTAVLHAYNIEKFNWEDIYKIITYETLYSSHKKNEMRQ